jgi:hypothetical protein
MIKIFALASVVFLTACGSFSRYGAAVTGYTNECVDGVAYIQFISGVTVKYNRDGSIATCNE